MRWVLEVVAQKAGEALAKAVERKALHFLGLTRLDDDLYLLLKGGREWQVGFVWRF